MLNLWVSQQQGRSSGFYPTDLGASLLGLWDAEVPAQFTLSGTNVITWTDGVATCSPTQSTTANRPTLSATVLNNRPAVVFDGSNDSLVLASTPFPTGANPCEIWALVKQDALAADNLAGVILTYGGGTNATNRIVRRMVTSGVNRLGGLTGTGAAPTVSNTSVDFSGIHVIRYVATGTQQRVDIDDNTGTSGSAVPTTGTTALAIGATTGGGGQFFKGAINMIVVTTILTTEQATQMSLFMKSRGGLS